MSITKYQYDNYTFASQINSYLESFDHTYAQAIENFLEKMCKVDKAELWFYADDTLSPLKTPDKQITITPSLTQAAIQTKETQIENHIVSSKNFEPKIDNYFNLNIKAVMIYPVAGEKGVVGIVKLFMLIGNDITINQQKEEKLKSLQNYLHHLFTKEIIDTENLNIQTKSHINITESSKNIEAIEELRKKNTQYANLLAITEKELQSYKNTVAQYKKRNAQHLEIIDKLKEKIRSTQEETPEAEALIANLRNKIQEDEQHYKRNLTKYKEIIHRLENKEKRYQEEIKHLQTVAENTPLANTEDKRKNHILETEKALKGKTALPPIQMYTSNIRTLQNVRIVHDLIHFSVSSHESASHLEKIFYTTKFLNKLIKKYSLRNSIPVKKHKHPIEETVRILQRYQQTVFDDKLNLQVRKHNSVPPNIYCDAEKMQQILMYLLIDLSEISDTKHPIYIDIHYERKIITFKIKSKINQKRKPGSFPLMIKQFFNADNTRLCLKFAQKLTKYVNGEINSSEQEEGYTHIFMLSASDSASD